VGKAVIAELSRALDLAYRKDRFHALRRNLADVRDDEFAVEPGDHSVEVFGSQPELSVRDLVLHVGGAKVMYGNRAFGDGTMHWGGITIPDLQRPAVEEWLEAAHEVFATGLAGLDDDDRLEEPRTTPWGTQMRLGDMVRLVISHDLYHSGELNRQRSLIRGATGWKR
jgi:hypothetical protein